MQEYITRLQETALKASLSANPVSALLGPRQCGKSTLARKALAEIPGAAFLDLERASDARKIADPEYFFNLNCDRLICIDEIQRAPHIFPAMRVAVDDARRPGRFIILGSASLDLIRHSSETLAGRIHFLELTPFRLPEVASDEDATHNKLWLRGGFPPSFLAQSLERSIEWRENFIRTYLERDIPLLNLKIPAKAMHRLWMMLAHYHGGLLNLSKIGQSLDISHTTVHNYIDILEQTFMLRILRPMAVNLKKRLVKSPKVFVRDSGILHALLEIDTMDDLFGHPVFGASWEGFCIEQIIAALPDWRSGFYRTDSGEEIDLVLERGQKRLVFECKASPAPRLSKSFPTTFELLRPDAGWVVAPVKEPYSISPGVTVAGLSAVLRELKNWQAFSYTTRG